jgi:CheY-like chemotaxis protein
MNIQSPNTLSFNPNQSILIVDHYNVGQRIALMQLQYFGLTAHVVTSCRQAIKAVNNDHYALVLIGWGRPECAGSAFINFVRRQDEIRSTHTTVVAVVAHARAGNTNRSLASGIDDLISKPITMSDMYELLARNLEAAA